MDNNRTRISYFKQVTTFVFILIGKNLVGNRWVMKLFLLSVFQAGTGVEFEKNDVSILDDVVSALLSVFARRLNIVNAVRELRSPKYCTEVGNNFTLTAFSEPSALKSSNFMTSAIMKPFSKSV